MSQFDKIVFGKKKFSDLLEEIYDNQKKKDKQVTALVKELPKNQVYVGVTGIVGNSSALIGPQLTLKTKKDNLYGANLLIDGNGNKYFGVSVGWKIKLKK